MSNTKGRAMMALWELGYNPKHRGTLYTAEAIAAAAATPRPQRMAEVYNGIAAAHGITPVIAERVMRYAKEAARRSEYWATEWQALRGSPAPTVQEVMLRVRADMERWEGNAD